MKNHGHLFCLFLLTACATSPGSGDKDLVLINESQEIEIGRVNYGPTIQSFDGLYPDDDVQDFVRDIGRKLASVSQRPGLKYEFNVVNTSLVNAFALPGGKVCITRGLLSHLENESQLAAILAHEIGHVTARHGVRTLSREMLMGGLINLGAVTMETKHVSNREAILAMANLGIQAGLSKYSRQQETQSDELALSYMSRANYNTDGALQVFEMFNKLQTRETSFIDQMFASHPLSRERVAHMKALLSTQYAVSRGKASTQTTPEFEQLKAKLKRESAFYKAHDDGVRAAVHKRWNESVADLKKALAGKPNEALFQADLGYIYLMKDDIVNSEIHLKKAVEIYPDFFKSNYFLGYLFYKKSKYNDAERHLNKADDLIPGIPIVRLLLGESYEHRGNLDQAVAFYKYVYQSDSGRAGEVAANHLVRLGVLKPKTR